MVIAKKQNQGFSLIELMIGIVLLAVLLGIGVPSFRGIVADTRLRAASTDIRLALTTARSEAVKRNRSVFLTPSTGAWGNGWIASLDPNDPDSPRFLEHVQAEGLSVTGPDVVSFNSFGRSTAAEFEIELAGMDGAAMCLNMQTDGRATAAHGECPDD